jgi:hypothetical protein
MMLLEWIVELQQSRITATVIMPNAKYEMHLLCCGRHPTMSSNCAAAITPGRFGAKNKRYLGSCSFI